MKLTKKDFEKITKEYGEFDSWFAIDMGTTIFSVHFKNLWQRIYFGMLIILRLSYVPKTIVFQVKSKTKPLTTNTGSSGSSLEI